MFPAEIVGKLVYITAWLSIVKGGKSNASKMMKDLERESPIKVTRIKP